MKILAGWRGQSGHYRFRLWMDAYQRHAPCEATDASTAMAVEAALADVPGQEYRLLLNRAGLSHLR